MEWDILFINSALGMEAILKHSQHFIFYVHVPFFEKSRQIYIAYIMILQRNYENSINKFLLKPIIY